MKPFLDVMQKTIKFSHSIKFFKNLAALLFLFLLAGCLTSPNPFYNESDIIQDPRFLGFFVDEELGLTVTISPDETSDNVCIVYEYACVSDFKKYAKDFEKIRQTFQLK